MYIYMISPLLLFTLLTVTPVWTSKEIFTSWTDKGVGYEYVLEVYTDRDFNNLYLSKDPNTKIYTYTTYYDTNLYFQRVKYYPATSPESYEYMDLGQFYLNLEYGILSEDIPDIFPTPPQPPPQPQPEPEENIPDPVIEEDIPEDVLDISTEEVFTLSQNIDYRENILSNSEMAVLGTSTQNTEICNISLLRDDEIKIKSWECPLDIQISKVEYLNWDDYKSLEIQGTYPNYINTDIKIYECKKFTLFEPKTWFGCKEILVDIYKGDIKLIYSGSIYIDGSVLKGSNFGFMDTSFYLGNRVKDDISKSKVQIYLNIYSQFKSKEWTDIQYTIKKDVPLPQLKEAVVKKPFSFPLDRLIGVTQWHGCTQYQCPHKGIDFGASLNKVVSIGDGTVTKVGYDMYGGECNQGGNYVIVKHTNGMYSTYFHLDSYSVSVGTRVSKGTLIGISGNSGKKNCQPLKYHLHFETRNGSSSSTHVNPVEYIDVDWNLIPTLGYIQYPGRLTGDNPHPNF